MRALVITAVGDDRPGIVAALSEALLRAGGNLSDCRAALLSGSFAIVLAVSLPDETEERGLEEALQEVGDRLGLVVRVGPAGSAAAGPRRDRCLVSVYGSDHPGILHAVAATLARHGINVVDLSSRVVGDPPIYVVGIEAEIPAGMDIDGLRTLLRPVAAEQRVEVSVTAADDGGM